MLSPIVLDKVADLLRNSWNFLKEFLKISSCAREPWASSLIARISALGLSWVAFALKILYFRVSTRL